MTKRLKAKKQTTEFHGWQEKLQEKQTDRNLRKKERMRYPRGITQTDRNQRKTTEIQYGHTERQISKIDRKSEIPPPQKNARV